MVFFYILFILLNIIILIINEIQNMELYKSNKKHKEKQMLKKD